MRLTIYNITEIDISNYQKSISRIFDGYQLTQTPNRTTYVAVFNGSVLGIASAQDNNIDYFKILDITRNRGVGCYLLQEFCNSLLNKHKEIYLSEEILNNNDLLKFTQKYGFINGKLNKQIRIW